MAKQWEALDFDLVIIENPGPRAEHLVTTPAHYIVVGRTETAESKKREKLV